MTRPLMTLTAALAAFTLAAAPASAKDAPPPQPATDPCEPYWNLPAYEDGALPVVNGSAGGCVIVRHSLTGVNSLDRVVLVPGWTYEVKANGDGTNSRVQVDFRHTATGGTTSVRVENGKTIIR